MSNKIKFKYFWILILFTLLLTCIDSRRKRKHKGRNYKSPNPSTARICIGADKTLRARHKSCFLRPDTGPCRADIIQWYFDVRQKKCYRFFWGGCQGNGNRFETFRDCFDYCHLNMSHPILTVPRFCSLTFDYGTCYGYFNRWGWDTLTKSCRRRLYSGCGGNQNNFQTLAECIKTCVNPPNNTLIKYNSLTTCVPVEIPDIL